MIFQHTVMKVLLGEKTQTRRLVGLWDNSHGGGGRLFWVEDYNGHKRFEINKTYAVQMGRGKPRVFYKRTPEGISIYDAIPPNPPKNLREIVPDDYLEARINIEVIRHEDVRRISPEDAKAEGFDSPEDFWLVWCNMHDKRLKLEKSASGGFSFVNEYNRKLRDDVIPAYLRNVLNNRSQHLYEAWVLEFRLVA